MNGRVLVTRLKPADVSRGGIVIPEGAQERNVRAKVIASGSKLIQADQIVYLQRWAGQALQLDGKDVLIVPESEVLAVEE